MNWWKIKEEKRKILKERDATIFRVLPYCGSGAKKKKSTSHKGKWSSEESSETPQYRKFSP